jgi:hypothetical protein
VNRTTVVALLLFVTASVARAQTNAAPAIGEFYNATAGQYQVLAQSGGDMAWQVNQFMNQMLQQYSRYFSNWSLKAGARVIVFSNAEDFRAYAIAPMGLVHGGLAGYCHLKTDEDGNTFYELVTYEHDNLWQVLAHEGFHQFIGYELGLEVPIWLNSISKRATSPTAVCVRGRSTSQSCGPRSLCVAPDKLSRFPNCFRWIGRRFTPMHRSLTP